jgi:CubicO group peptidase (beta-lactamase class C family)
MRCLLGALLALLIAGTAWTAAGQLPANAASGEDPVAAFIADYAAKHDFSGSILVEKKGHTVYTGSFGYADIAFKVPNTPETRYKIASITKLFTSVLVMQLAEQGRIDVSRTISTYLPGYAGPAADKVTLHELLNHTSGISNYDQVTRADEAIHGGIPNYQHPYTSDQLLRLFASGPLVSPPGTKFDYNNGDYIILGKIIERLYGKPYEQVLNERILAPLGMRNSGVLHQSDIVPKLAPTYFYRDDLKSLANDLPAYSENWYAAGAMYSTLEDLRTFSDALFGLKLVGSKSLTLMTTPGLEDYGYGLWSYEIKVAGKPYRVVKRPGQIMGAQTQLYHVFDADVTVVLLSNTATTDLDEFVAKIGTTALSVH